MKRTVLVVDDDESVRKALRRSLSRLGYDVIVQDTGRRVLEVLSTEPVDVVLLDLQMPDMDGLEVLAAMRAGDCSQPVLMMSGSGSIEAAVKAVQLGALDFIQKPLVPERVAISIQNAIKYERLHRDKEALEQESSAHGEILGDSQPIRDLKQLITKAAPTEGRILITGENGTGKELVAAALHHGSKRSDEPLVKLNCAAVPSNLIESELFGHEKGAFTGAVASRRGKFELAHGGTLFLDEVGEMPPEMQPKLLRVLQEGELERVGGTKTLKVDVRVVAATNRDLLAMIEKGLFREDLYYRLNVIEIYMPPLRTHKEDLPALVHSFAAHSALRNNKPGIKVSEAAIAALSEQDFPGNVRELQNLVERLVILSEGDVINASDVELTARSRGSSSASRSLYRPAVSFKQLVEEAQRDILSAALSRHTFNMTETARSLELERSHLYKKCRALGVETKRATAGAAPPDEETASA